jgi:hypothetical protein
MEVLEITSAQYTKGDEPNDPIYGVDVVVNGVRMSVPLDPANRHYAQILHQVEAGSLAIQAADENVTEA